MCEAGSDFGFEVTSQQHYHQRSINDVGKKRSWFTNWLPVCSSWTCCQHPGGTVWRSGMMATCIQRESFCDRCRFLCDVQLVCMWLLKVSLEATVDPLLLIGQWMCGSVFSLQRFSYPGHADLWRANQHAELHISEVHSTRGTAHQCFWLQAQQLVAELPQQ